MILAYAEWFFGIWIGGIGNYLVRSSFQECFFTNANLLCWWLPLPRCSWYWQMLGYSQLRDTKHVRFDLPPAASKYTKPEVTFEIAARLLSGDCQKFLVSSSQRVMRIKSLIEAWVADIHKVDRGTVSVTLFFGTRELKAQRTLAHYGITTRNAKVSTSNCAARRL